MPICQLLLGFDIIALLESVNTSAGIYELLFTSKERMAAGADIYTKVFLSGACFDSCTASTLYNGGLIVGMDSLLHNTFHLFQYSNSINKQSKYTFQHTSA